MDGATHAQKHVVITGGTAGIGRAMVERLRRDHVITVIARRSAHLERLRDTLPEVNVIEADLADIGTVRAAAAQVIASGRSVDTLINNAAVQHTPHFDDPAFDEHSIEREIAVNLTAPSVLIQSVLPALLAGGGGTVLNINSGLGLVPKTASAVYCATKFGLNGLSLALANQLEHAGVRVVQAFLPLVDTGMTAGRGAGKLSADDAAKRILEGLDAGRDPIDVGKVTLLRAIMRLSPALARRIMRRG
ncbi:MAG: SDR family NAD(P)-dependent oxidoreductase [Pseudomonadota bacterium]